MSAAKIIGIAVKTATIRELAHERLVGGIRISFLIVDMII